MNFFRAKLELENDLLSGTSKYSRLKNISCPYAVEWVGSGGILKARCSKEKI